MWLSPAEWEGHIRPDGNGGLALRLPLPGVLLPQGGDQFLLRPREDAVTLGARLPGRMFQIEPPPGVLAVAAPAISECRLLVLSIERRHLPCVLGEAATSLVVGEWQDKVRRFFLHAGADVVRHVVEVL